MNDEWEWIATGHDPDRSRAARTQEARVSRRRRRAVRCLTVMCVICVLTASLVFSWILIERHHSQRVQAAEAASAVTVAGRDLSATADAYNRRLASAPQTIGETTFDSGASGDFSFADDTEYHRTADYGDGVMGQLIIPSIGVDMPIRHGADAHALEHGAGHLHGTSLPVGGTDTHAVLTGHTGMAMDSLFSRLHDMRMGDVFYIRTGNRTLAYRVVQIRTVLPRDTAALRIQQGRDLVTLVTCTPIFVNTHRLLVTGERQNMPEQVPYLHDAAVSAGRRHAAGSIMVAPLALALPMMIVISRRRGLLHARHADGTLTSCPA